MDLLTRLVKESSQVQQGGFWQDPELLCHDLKTAIPINIQNVADYIYARARPIHFRSEFPNLAPPWPLFFMFYKMPQLWGSSSGPVDALTGSEFGYLFLTKPLPDGWEIETLIFVDNGKKIGVIGVLYEVDETGQFRAVAGADGLRWATTPLITWPEGHPVDKLRMPDNSWSGHIFMFAPCLAISFCHCKNVEIIRQPVPSKVKAKRERKYGWSPNQWHALQIEPMRRQLDAAGANEPGGLQRALHIMRGHFKDYRERRGLFGKTHGMWWWDFRLSNSTHPHRYRIEKTGQ